MAMSFVPPPTVGNFAPPPSAAISRGPPAAGPSYYGNTNAGRPDSSESDCQCPGPPGSNCFLVSSIVVAIPLALLSGLTLFTACI